MQYRDFGNIGLKVSALGFGTICLLQTNAFIDLSKRYTGEEIRKGRKREGRSVRQFFRETFFPWRYD